jgi:hypothetical protein
MNYPQSTLEEIIDSERAMILDARTRYGRHYTHARETTLYLSHCIESMKDDRADTFGRLFALLKKHHTLSFFSFLRLHKVQAMMNLRQVLEAGAAAAFAIAKPEACHFVNIDAFDIMDPAQTLTNKRYKWLDQTYPKKSAWIKSTKDRINSYTAHANIISGNSTFRGADDHTAANMPFFDIEDEYFVKADLWLIGSVAITLMDFFFSMANDVARAGRSVLDFRSDFQRTIGGMAAESNGLLAEMRSTERFKRAMQKEAQRTQGAQEPDQG